MNLKKYYNLGKNILYPINRSLTGDGTKKTLKIIKNQFKDFKIKSIKSGSKVFDWTIPPEWNVKEAIENLQKKIVPKNIYLGEPQLGKRNLYSDKTSKYTNHRQAQYMNFLQYADGRSSLERIAFKINISLKKTKKIFGLLVKNKLIN